MCVVSLVSLNWSEIVFALSLPTNGVGIKKHVNGEWHLRQGQSHDSITSRSGIQQQQGVVIDSEEKRRRRRIGDNEIEKRNTLLMCI